MDDKEKDSALIDTSISGEKNNVSDILRKLGMPPVNKSKTNADMDTPEDIRRVLTGDLKGSKKFDKVFTSKMKQTWGLRPRNKSSATCDESDVSPDGTPLINDISRIEDSPCWEPNSDEQESSEDTNHEDSKDPLLKCMKTPKRKGKKIQQATTSELEGATPSPLKGFKRLILRE